MGARSQDFKRYVEACNYPGAIDPEAVQHYLEEYVRALGIMRQVVQLQAGWTLEQHPGLWKSVV